MNENGRQERSPNATFCPVCVDPRTALKMTEYGYIPKFCPEHIKALAKPLVGAGTLKK